MNVGLKVSTSVPSFLTHLYRDPSGFPPPDNALLDWFASRDSEDQADVAKKPHGFMSSLIIVVHDRLEDIASKEEYGDCPVTSSRTMS
jgi:hypothetical protein